MKKSQPVDKDLFQNEAPSSSAKNIFIQGFIFIQLQQTLEIFTLYVQMKFDTVSLVL